MHPDDLPVNDAMIRALVTQHAPQWAALPLQRVDSSGTDNAMFRIGSELVLRIPRRRSAVALLSKELDWLAHLHGLPLKIPTLRYRGQLGPEIDREFGIFDWIHGETATPEMIADADRAAIALANFLKALHNVPTDGAPVAGPSNNSRGGPLATVTTRTVAAIKTVSDEIDASAAVALWEDAVSVTYDAPGVWLHGDLKADNLITADGDLVGIIDWGLSAVGDPAADYATAWSWVEPSARSTFRDVLELNDSDWLRAKGWALYGAVIALSYYRGGKNEQLCQQCRLTLSRLELLR